MDELTAEQIAQHYTSMGHSVDLINAIIAGTAMADDEAVDKQGNGNDNANEQDGVVAVLLSEDDMVDVFDRNLDILPLLRRTADLLVVGGIRATDLVERDRTVGAKDHGGNTPRLALNCAGF